MLKKLIAAIILLMVALLAFRCNHIRAHGIRLDPGAFAEMAGVEDIGIPMEELKFEGASDGKVYLKSWKLNRIPETILYWTELNGLPKDIQDQIRNNAGRWKRK